MTQDEEMSDTEMWAEYKRPKFYVLVNRVPVPELNLTSWSNMFGTFDRTVRKSEGKITLDGNNMGEITVSTVFLGIDHAVQGPPMLFETMVFGGPSDGEQDRCSTWEAAEKMHEAMVLKVKLDVKSLEL